MECGVSVDAVIKGFSISESGEVRGRTVVVDLRFISYEEMSRSRFM